MQLIILAGGLGTRLRPFTEVVPKAMVSIRGKPFLYYLINHLSKQGLRDIILCIGYLGEQIRDYFGDGSKFGVRLKYSVENKKLLGTAGALQNAKSFLADRFYVINGDTYLPIDYFSVEKRFIESNKKAVMVVCDHSEITTAHGNVKLNADLIVTKYTKSVLDPLLKYVDAGALILKRETLDHLDDGCIDSLESAVYQPLILKRELTAYITNHRFYDIGTPEQLKAFEEYLG